MGFPLCCCFFSNRICEPKTCKSLAKPLHNDMFLIKLWLSLWWVHCFALKIIGFLLLPKIANERAPDTMNGQNLLEFKCFTFTLREDEAQMIKICLKLYENNRCQRKEKLCQTLFSYAAEMRWWRLFIFAKLPTEDMSLVNLASRGEVIWVKDHVGYH